MSATAELHVASPQNSHQGGGAEGGGEAGGGGAEGGGTTQVSQVEPPSPSVLPTTQGSPAQHLPLSGL